MNLLFRVIDAAYSVSSHHRMALDALPLMTGPEALLRRGVYLFWHEPYLKGSKAPDDEFKDFRNHVLHVEENLWGGAPQAAREWFDRTVEDLKRENWDQAAFSAGVLSHYVTDPFQPFHTGSSDKETHFHRAVEWSIAKSFPALRQRIVASGGYPKVELPTGSDWLEETILAGAQRAHQDYALPFERFDLERGSKTPEEGLDDVLAESFAALIAQATATFAAILDRAWEHSRAIPPDVNLSAAAVVAALKMPIAWVVKKLVETEEQRTVLAIYDEIRRTGKLTRYLPEECHAIDMQHAQERLASMPLSRFAERRLAKSKEEKPARAGSPARIAAEPKPAPTIAKPSQPRSDQPLRSEAPQREKAAALPPPFPKSPEISKPAASVPATKPSADAVLTNDAPAVESARPREPERADRRQLRWYLELDAPIVDAPSIGPKTAKRFEQAGVRTVAEFLRSPAEQFSKRLDAEHLSASRLREMQAQARLVLQIAGLRGHDAQFLVGAGYTEPDEIAASKAEELLADVLAFIETPEGERALRSGSKPDIDEVRGWIEHAMRPRTITSKAA